MVTSFLPRLGLSLHEALVRAGMLDLKLVQLWKKKNWLRP